MSDTIPADLWFTEDHEWARLEADGSVTIGITHHAQDALGDVVYVELPAVGDLLEAQAPFGVVESVKSVSDLYSPIDGEVVAVNEALQDAEGTINEDPYGAGWLVRIEPAGEDALTGLLDAAAYEAFLAAEAH